jgi:hypothetical protein
MQFSQREVDQGCDLVLGSEDVDFGMEEEVVVFGVEA